MESENSYDRLIEEAIIIAKNVEGTTAFVEALWNGGFPRQMLENVCPFTLFRLESQSLPDRYRLDGVIQQGGMGCVYRAFDKKLKREVALKKDIGALENVAANPSLRTTNRADGTAKLSEELELAAGLSHPGIVPIHNIVEDKFGQPLGEMKILPKSTLQDHIGTFHRERNKLPKQFDVLLRHLVFVCKTVSYLHSERVVHCDIKPENVIVGEHGENYLIDFGISFRIGGEKKPRIGGSKGYKAPEQQQGSPILASDIYSLGAVLHAIMYGAPELNENTATAVRFSYPRWRKLDAIVRKAKKANPDDRYRNAMEFAVDLEEFLADRPILAARDSFLERVSRFFRKRLLSVVAVTIVVAIASILILIQNGQLNVANIEVSKQLERADQIADASLDLSLDLSLYSGGLLALSEDTIPFSIDLMNRTNAFSQDLRKRGLMISDLKPSQQVAILKQQTALASNKLKLLRRLLTGQKNGSKDTTSLESTIVSARESYKEKLTLLHSLLETSFEADPEAYAVDYFNVRLDYVRKFSPSDDKVAFLDKYISDLKMEISIRPKVNHNTQLGSALASKSAFTEDSKLAYEILVGAWEILRHTVGRNRMNVAKQLAETKQANGEFFSALALLEEEYVVLNKKVPLLKHVFFDQVNAPALGFEVMGAAYGCGDLIAAREFGRELFEALETNTPQELGLTPEIMRQLPSRLLQVEYSLNGPGAIKPYALQIIKESTAQIAEGRDAHIPFLAIADAEIILGIRELERGKIEIAKNHFLECIETLRNGLRKFPKHSKTFEYRIASASKQLQSSDKMPAHINEIIDQADYDVTKVLIRQSVARQKLDDANRLFNLMESYRSNAEKSIDDDLAIMAGLISMAVPADRQMKWQEKCFSYLKSTFDAGMADGATDWQYFVNSGIEFSDIRKTERFREIVISAAERRMETRFKNYLGANVLSGLARSLKLLNDPSGKADLLAAKCYVLIANLLKESWTTEIAFAKCEDALQVANSKVPGLFKWADSKTVEFFAKFKNRQVISKLFALPKQ